MPLMHYVKHNVNKFSLLITKKCLREATDHGDSLAVSSRLLGLQQKCPATELGVTVSWYTELMVTCRAEALTTGTSAADISTIFGQNLVSYCMRVVCQIRLCLCESWVYFVISCVSAAEHCIVKSSKAEVSLACAWHMTPVRDSSFSVQMHRCPCTMGNFSSLFLFQMLFTHINIPCTFRSDFFSDFK